MSRELQELKKEMLQAIDTICKEYEAKKVNYPLFKRWKTTGEIVKFSGLRGGITVVTGDSISHGVGYTSDGFIYDTSTDWEDVPYDAERDLFHTQAVECWDNEDTHTRALYFYDAINRSAFGYSGSLDGFFYENYKAIPLDKVPEWMNEARPSLEK